MRIRSVSALALLSLWGLAGLALPSVARAEERFTEVNGQTVRLIACFEQITLPAKYRVTPVVLEQAKRQYVQRRDGTVELVEFPARYGEQRELLEASSVELREIPCRDRKGVFGF